jgi:hypothetical protein
MKKLDWKQIYKIGSSDKQNRWYPDAEIAEYFCLLRAPSGAWPHSYAKAAQTVKFAKWLIENHPTIAQKVGILTSHTTEA